MKKINYENLNLKIIGNYDAKKKLFFGIISKGTSKYDGQIARQKIINMFSLDIEDYI